MMNRTSSYDSIYEHTTIESSLLEWIHSFSIDTPPQTFDQLYTGVALYEVLNRVDMYYWPKSKLTKSTLSMGGKQAGVSNFRALVEGMEHFY